MEVSISGQLMGLLCFSCLGLVLGLIYDLLRPFRYFLRAGFLWDFIFCALGAAAFFTLGMRSGRADTWCIAAALLFFCLYINLISPLLMPHFIGIFKLMHNFFVSLLKSSEKLLFSVKNFFTNVPD